MFVQMPTYVGDHYLSKVKLYSEEKKCWPVDLLSMFDNLQKISLLSVESLFFSKELL